jgi:hypothetical protein
LRKKTAVVRIEGGGVEADGLRKRTVVARSKAAVEAATCSGTGVEAVACSNARIANDKWQR